MGERWTRRRRCLWWGILTFILTAGCFVVIVNTYLFVNNGEFMFPNRNKRLAEKTLGASLPDDAGDLDCFEHTIPGSDTGFRVTYIKFSTSRESYLDLMRRLDAEMYEESAQRWYYLWPADWQGPADLDWWDPSFETPTDAAARSSVDGDAWIRALYENGYAYIKAK